jgi:hypothetical protein
MPGGGIDLGFNAETPSSLIPTGQPPTPMRPVATPDIQTARQAVADQQAALGYVTTGLCSY